MKTKNQFVVYCSANIVGVDNISVDCCHYKKKRSSALFSISKYLIQLSKLNVKTYLGLRAKCPILCSISVKIWIFFSPTDFSLKHTIPNQT